MKRSLRGMELHHGSCKTVLRICRRKNQHKILMASIHHMTIILLIGILTLTSLSGVTASASTVLMPFQKSKLQRMLHSRCHSPLHHISHYHKDDDGGNSAIWSWEGKLTDPATGQLICNVEGIELVRLLSEWGMSVTSASHQKQEERTKVTNAGALCHHSRFTPSR